MRRKPSASRSRGDSRCKSTRLSERPHMTNTTPRQGFWGLGVLGPREERNGVAKTLKPQSPKALRWLAATAWLLASACSTFDTDISNPNAVSEGALGDPASAPPLVNGLAGSVIRALTGIYG